MAKSTTVRLRPIEIEAYQHLGPGTMMIGRGAQVAFPGDWILTDPKGGRHVFGDLAMRAMAVMEDE